MRLLSLIILLLMCSDKRIVGERTNPLMINVLGWLTVALMTAAAAFMDWAMASGSPSRMLQDSQNDNLR